MGVEGRIIVTEISTKPHLPLSFLFDDARSRSQAAHDRTDEELFADLLRRKTVSVTTAIKGPYEKASKEAFIELDIRAVYELHQFKMESNGTTTVYLPDFLTNLVYNGKQVIFEPHTGGEYADSKFCRRVRKMREMHGERIYIIALRYPSPRAYEHTAPRHGEEYADEIWTMPMILQSGTKAEIKRSSNTWKKLFKSRIREFSSRGAVLVRDPEEIARLESTLFEMLRKAS